MPAAALNRSSWAIPIFVFVVALMLVVAIQHTSGGPHADAADETDEITWTIEVGPPDPFVGDTVTVSANACCFGQSPLLFAQLTVDAPGGQPVLGEATPVGGYASWELPALGAGTTTLRVSGTLEKWICPTPGVFSQDCTRSYRYVTSPDVTVVVAGRALRGDANCDGRASSIDAALVLQYAARLIDALACTESADVDEDGAIDAIDAALILQHEAGLLDEL